MRTLQTHHHSCPAPSCRAPRGFTLVELLVVITIIGVLIALLVVALGAAQTSVQQAAIKTEISGVGQALKSLTTQYSTDYPPDFSVIVPLNKQQQIDRYLSRIFRNRNPLTDVPRANTDSRRGKVDLRPERLQFLDPSEALWLWLRGFSSDPQNPLFGRPTTPPELVERTPLFEFDKSRLKDTDGDGFMEYYPRYGQQQPYVYYANYNYLANFAKNPDISSQQLVCRLGPIPNALLLAPRPYLSTATVAIPNPTIKNHYAASDTFQIIACGLDGEFGFPVDNTNQNQWTAFAFPTGPYPDASKSHRDNITNFAEGTLESSMP